MAELFGRRKAVCLSTKLRGQHSGHTQEFPFNSHRARVRLPAAEFPGEQSRARR